MTSKDYRRRAEEKINPFITNAVIIYLIFFVIMSAVSGTFIGALILSGPLSLGLIKFIKATYNKEKADLGILFKGFENFVQAMVLWLLKSVFVFLWSLLLFVPGVIKAFAYSMSMYILEEDPTMDPMLVLKKSADMMKGHKWALFCLYFSYIGWIILSILTFGILFLWVKPKMDMAHYEFYLDLKTGRRSEVADIREIR